MKHGVDVEGAEAVAGRAGARWICFGGRGGGGGGVGSAEGGGAGEEGLDGGELGRHDWCFSVIVGGGLGEG